MAKKTLVSLTLVLAACGSGGGASERIAGVITLERGSETVDVPDDSELLVELVDVSEADAASVTIASDTIDLTEFPVSYELSWDEPLDDSREYAVSARVIAGDQLVFINDTRFPVTQSDSDVDFFVIAVEN